MTQQNTLKDRLLRHQIRSTIVDLQSRIEETESEAVLVYLDDCLQHLINIEEAIENGETKYNDWEI